MWSLHCISSKWAEPKYSCRAAQGVTEVLYTECYSLQFNDGKIIRCIGKTILEESDQEYDKNFICSKQHDKIQIQHIIILYQILLYYLISLQMPSVRIAMLYFDD